MNIEFQNEVTHLIATKLNESRSEKNMVFYGSSSFRLWTGLDRAFPELNPLNIAFGGSTIEDCVGYYPLLLAQTNPTHIVFYGGDNDIGNGSSATEVLGRLEALLSLIRLDFPEVPFTFLSIKPSPAREQYLGIIEASNQLIQEFLSAQSQTSYVDIHYAMRGKDGVVNMDLFEEDQLHMNPEGYAIWTKALRKHFLLNEH